MRSMMTLITALIGIVLLCTALPAHATDGDYFSVSGTVTDANWNPIPGALVSLYDNDFNLVTTQDTNSQGYFSFEGVSVKTNLCNLRVSYQDSDGTVHDLPGYYIPSQTASGSIQLAGTMTHYDDYTLPGSLPHETATPEPTPAPAPTVDPTPVPAAQDNSTVVYILLFAGGFIAGAAVATLACFILLRKR